MLYERSCCVTVSSSDSTCEMYFGKVCQMSALQTNNALVWRSCLISLWSLLKFPCVSVCWCVWVWKLRTALEAMRCVYAVYTHTHLSNTNDLNKARWKLSFTSRLTGVCTHKLSYGNREAAASQVQQDKKETFNTSCHSRSKSCFTSQTLTNREDNRQLLLTSWRWGAVSAQGQSWQGWRGQAPQHVGEEVGVGGHREAIQVSPWHRVALPSHVGSITNPQRQ